MFVDNLQLYKEILKPDIATCENITGVWSDYTTGNISITLLGESYSEYISGERTVSVEQNGCNVDIVFSTNTHSGQGTINGNTITYEGSGKLLGIFTYLGSTYPISISLPEKSTLTRLSGSTNMASHNESMYDESSSKHFMVDILIDTFKTVTEKINSISTPNMNHSEYRLSINNEPEF